MKPDIYITRHRQLAACEHSLTADMRMPRKTRFGRLSQSALATFGVARALSLSAGPLLLLE